MKRQLNNSIVTSEQRKQQPKGYKQQSVLKGGILVREKYRHYGYHFEDYDNKNYEVIRFKYIESSEMIKKGDNYSGGYKFNHVVHFDNSCA